MLSRKIHGIREVVVLLFRNFHERQKVLMKNVHGNCEERRRKIHDGRIGKIHDGRMIHDYDEKFLN